jgi:hypothetical protein
MSDLSRLLGDVYNSGPQGAEPPWSSDTALDDAFADWVPGPPADASPAERSFLPDDDADEQIEALLEQAARFAPLVEELDEVGEVHEVEELAVDEVDEPSPFEASEPVESMEAPAPIDPTFVAPLPVQAWSREDDDILPGGRHRRRARSFSRR